MRDRRRPGIQGHPPACRSLKLSSAIKEMRLSIECSVGEGGRSWRAGSHAVRSLIEQSGGDSLLLMGRICPDCPAEPAVDPPRSDLECDPAGRAAWRSRSGPPRPPVPCCLCHCKAYLSAEEGSEVRSGARWGVAMNPELLRVGWL